MYKFAYDNTIKDNKKRIFGVGLLMLLTSLISVMSSTLLMKIIDYILPSAQLKLIIYAVIVYVLIAISQSVVSYFYSIQNTLLTIESANKLKLKIINKIFIRNGDYFTQNSRGELYQNVEYDSFQFTNFVIGNVISIIITIVNLVVAIVYLAMLDWKLTLIVIVIQPISFVFEMMMKPKIIKVSKESRDISGDYSTITQEILTNPIELILSGYKNNLISKFVKMMKKYLEVTKKSITINMFSANAGNFLGSITLCAVIAYSGISIISKNMSIGELVVFITYSQKIVSAVSSLVNFSIDQSEIIPIYERVKEQILYKSPEKISQPEFTDSPEIKLQDVGFSYDGKVKIYDNINLKFEYGKKYGLMGKTGEGKSTIIKLLFSMWYPDSGKISIDDKDCADLAYEDISQIITYVSSNPIIINDTLYNNLTMFNKNINENDVWDVLKKVQLDTLFLTNDKKLNSIIGDNGVTLSSGQRQRLSLARTMLIGKKIIVLDEPTSALDEKTSKLITNLLFEEFNEQTLIIISHDKSVVTRCNKILTLEEKLKS